MRVKTVRLVFEDHHADLVPSSLLASCMQICDEDELQVFGKLLYWLRKAGRSVTP